MESPSAANSSQFDSYYQEFSNALHNLEQGPNNSTTGGSNNKAAAEDLEQQCTDLLRLMSIEARTTEDEDKKFERLERVKIYKFQVEAVQNKHQKDFILGDALQRNTGRHLKDTLRQNETKMAQQNELLERARRTVAETEDTAMEITEELQHNRETIQSSHGRVNEINSLTERAGKIATNMLKPWWRRRR